MIGKVQIYLLLLVVSIFIFDSCFSVPDGSSDVDNPVVYSWGLEKRKIGTNFFWHDEIAKGLGGLDMDAASKVSGARFSVLVGPLAKLERAIIQFFLDFHTSRGYKEVSVPYIVSRSTLEGTGIKLLLVAQLPFDRSEF